MSRGSEAMYDLAEAIKAKPDLTQRPTWRELYEVVKEAADWTSLGEYDDYMGEDQ